MASQTGALHVKRLRLGRTPIWHALNMEVVAYTSNHRHARKVVANHHCGPLQQRYT